MASSRKPCARGILPRGARITRAHCCGHGIELAFEGGPVGGMQLRPHPGQSRIGAPDVDIPILVAGTRYPHSSGVKARDPHIDALSGLGPRQPHPLGGMAGHRDIDLGDHLGIVDVLGARHQCRDEPEVDVAARKRLRHPWQPLPQGDRMPQPPAGSTPADS